MSTIELSVTYRGYRAYTTRDTVWVLDPFGEVVGQLHPGVRHYDDLSDQMAVIGAAIDGTRTLIDLLIANDVACEGLPHWTDAWTHGAAE